MESTDPWAAVLKLAALAAMAILTGIGGLVAGKLKKEAPRGEGEVVAATFTDKALMQQLVGALVALNPSVLRLVDLLEADAQRRHDAQVIREELERRGIKP